MNKLFISVNKQLYKPASTTNWIMFNYIIILTLFCPLARVGVGVGGKCLLSFVTLTWRPVLSPGSAVSTTLITAV